MTTFLPLPLRIALRMAVCMAAFMYMVYCASTQPHISEDDKPAAQGSSTWYLRAHEGDCWTGAAPADMQGKIPGHVIVTLPNGRTVYSHKWVGPALENLFGKEKTKGLAVTAFCR